MDELHPIRRLVDDLRRLGVSDGDVVMVHASLRKVGPVAGRAAGLIKARDIVPFGIAWMNAHLGKVSSAKL